MSKGQKDTRTYPDRAVWARARPWAVKAVIRLRYKAKKRGIPFNITSADIEIPEFCPVLGVRLRFDDRGGRYQASVDRIKPALGYVQGNIAVISRLANSIKQDATAVEIRLVAEWLETKETANVG